MPGPFQLRNYATFTGPLQKDEAAYSYELSEKEGIWHTDIPTDTSFPLTDVGLVFFRDFSDFSYFHLYASAPQIVVLEKQAGQKLPSLFLQVLNTIVNGNIIVNGTIVANKTITCNGIVVCNGVMKNTGAVIHGSSSTMNGAVTMNGAAAMNGAVAMTATATLAGVGDVATAINGKKSFDIPHPTKKEHRLRYVCVETPKADVYVRGKLKGSNVINLPEYWKGLVDPDSIDVVLSPIGSFQELYVEDVQWGTKVIVKNSAGGPINCSYVVYGERKDTEPNIPEYKGLTEADYPGDNSGYNINSD
jgi:hypothetical protein